MKYLHLFETQTDFESSYNGDNYIQPWVSLIEENDNLNYNKYSKEELDSFKIPLTFDIISDGNIIWKMSNGSASSDARTIKYSKDNGTTWTAITPTTSGVSIPVVSGDVIQFTGDNNAYGTTSYYNTFGASTAQFNVRGNIMSLLNSTSFNNLTTLGYQYIFNGLFRSCKGLIDASKLILPATRLATRCYKEMFYGCSSLTTAPALPATTLALGCYDGMFRGCSSLTTAPALPATTLASICYGYMFYECTNLTSAPILPATTLAPSCYYYMFYRCRSLTTAPELPATTLADYCYHYMFSQCTSLTTAPELPATTLAKYCYNTMFYGCTNLTTAPELPATTLVDHCYNEMFMYCTSLSYIKAMFTTTPSTTYTGDWVSNIKSTGTFVKNASATWDVTDTYGVPSGWTVETATA